MQRLDNNSRPLPLLMPKTLLTELSSEDSRLLDIFSQHIGSKLAGFLDSHLWTIMVPQIAHQEPVVISAVHALVDMHQVVERQGSIHPDQIGDKALMSYNRAIRSLVHHRMDTPNQTYVLLLVCVLFVAVEFLRGDAANASKHIIGGFSILERWKSVSRRDYRFVVSPHFSVAWPSSDDVAWLN